MLVASSPPRRENYILGVCRAKLGLRWRCVVARSAFLGLGLDLCRLILADVGPMLASFGRSWGYVGPNYVGL